MSTILEEKFGKILEKITSFKDNKRIRRRKRISERSKTKPKLCAENLETFRYTRLEDLDSVSVNALIVIKYTVADIMLTLAIAINTLLHVKYVP